MTASAPAWLDELPFMTEATDRSSVDSSVDRAVEQAEPRWLSMGLSRLDLDAGLIADDDRDEELAERRQLLDERHDDVFAARPGTAPAKAEVLSLVEAWWRATFSPDPSTNPSINPSTDLPTNVPTDPPIDASVDPLEAAGRLVQEDLCVLRPIDGTFRLEAACLCFPSHWRLHEKIGRTVAAIHAPVPRYEVELAARVDRFLDRLRPGAGARRRNWTVHDRPDRFAPWPPGPGERRRLVSADDVGAQRWLRSELQTLRRLPESGAVLFTIKTQRVPFAALAHRPDVARRLAARLRAQPPELTAANGVGPDLALVLTWLDRAAS